MLKHIKRILAEKTLMVSGAVTSIVILLMVFFLFRSGAGLFTQPEIERGYVLAVNAKNPIDRLSPQQIMQIFDGEITTWDKVSDYTGEITVVRLNDLTSYVSEEELGAEFEHVGACFARVIAENPGVIAYIPLEYAQNTTEEKILDEGEIRTADFFGGHQWYPTAQPAPQFGVLPLLLGTLWVTIGAILIALPFGLSAAIYLAELADPRVRKILKPAIELLAGIPSVVYGFFGLVVVVPALQKIFQLDVGETGLAGSIILAIMALPTIITVAEDALRTTPRAMKEASLALGATHWQTIYRVTVPYSRSGILAAVVLGLGRAIGETMAVLMVTGNAAVIPHTLLEPVRTIPATIAAELGEAPAGGAHYEALFLLGAILFVITLGISLAVEVMESKQTKQRM